MPLIDLRRTRTDYTTDGIAAGIAVTSTARALADMVPCPPLQGTTSLLLQIFQIVENVRENKDDCMRLAGRAGHILLNLNSRLTSVLPPSNHWERDPVLWDRTREAIPFGLRMNVDRFENTVNEVLECARRASNIGWVPRALFQTSIKKEINRLNERLTDSAEAFKVNALFDIQLSTSLISRQIACVDTLLSRAPSDALARDEFGFRIINRDEITLNSEVQLRSGFWKNLAEVKTADGKRGLVKRYYGPNAKQSMLYEMQNLRSLWHTNLPQLFGVSPQNSPVCFIVINTAPRRGYWDFFNHLKWDLKVVLPLYLSYHCDAGSLFNFLSTPGVISSTGAHPDSDLVRRHNAIVDVHGRVVFGGLPAGDVHEDMLQGRVSRANDLFIPATSDTTALDRCNRIYHNLYKPFDVGLRHVTHPAEELNLLASYHQVDSSDPDFPEEMRLRYPSNDGFPTCDFSFIHYRKFLWSLGCVRPHQCSLLRAWGKVGDIAYRIHSTTVEEFVTLGHVADEFGVVKTAENCIPRYTSFDGPPVKAILPGNIERYTFNNASFVHYDYLPPGEQLAFKDPIEAWECLLRRAPQIAREYSIPAHDIFLVTGIRKYRKHCNFERLPHGNSSPDAHLFGSFKDDTFEWHWSLDPDPTPVTPPAPLQAADIISYVKHDPWIMEYVQFEAEDFEGQESVAFISDIME